MRSLTVETGSSAVCPTSINVADKTPCDEDSVCYQGVSDTSHSLTLSLTLSLSLSLCVCVCVCVCVLYMMITVYSCPRVHNVMHYEAMSDSVLSFAVPNVQVH